MANSQLWFKELLCLRIEKSYMTVEMGLIEQDGIKWANLERNNSYRIMIDSAGVGYIRIIRRIDLKTLINIFKDLYIELKEILLKNHISIYVSRSIYEEMSSNIKHFHDLAVSCMDGTFDLIIIS